MTAYSDESTEKFLKLCCSPVLYGLYRVFELIVLVLWFSTLIHHISRHSSQLLSVKEL